MTQVGMAELKARLSEYLARVQAGEEVAQLRHLQRQGLVRVGTGVLPDAIWEMERPEDPQGMIRAGLEAERAEGH